MATRDLEFLTAVLQEPFVGYARHPAWSFTPAVERIVACSALLSVMVLAGVALGSSN